MNRECVITFHSGHPTARTIGHTIASRRNIPLDTSPLHITVKKKRIYEAYQKAQAKA